MGQDKITGKLADIEVGQTITGKLSDAQALAPATNGPPPPPPLPSEPGYFQQVFSRLKSIVGGLYDAWKTGDVPAMTGASALGEQFQIPLQGMRPAEKLTTMFPFVGPSINEAATAAAHGRWKEAGAIMTTDVALPLIGPEVAEGALGLAGKLRSKVGSGVMKQAAGFVTKTGAEEVTRPIIKSYLDKLEDTKTRQVEVDTATDIENRQIAQDAAKKTQEQEALHRAQVTGQEAGFQADVRKAGDLHVDKVMQVSEVNEGIAGVERQRQSMQHSLQERSRNLGEQVKQADRNLRQEGNQKYGTVREATAGDPGIPATDLIDAVKHAENNILKGSKESIKQFREILSMQPEEEVIETGVGTLDPHNPAHRNMIDYINSQGGVEPPEPVFIPFRDLQGYSSELGAKIAEGLKSGTGDVYRALKYVKGALDDAKMEIAERNDVADALTDADSFWHSYMDTFYDKTSAVAKIRKTVGVLDPEFYADPLVTGKSAKTGIGKLRGIESQYGPQLSQIADLAEGMGRTREEMGRLPKAAELKPTPAEPAPIEPPKEIQPPKPVEPKFKTPTQVKEPEAPTAKNIIEEKEERVRSKAAELAGLRRFDILKMLSHPLSGTVEVVAEKIAASGFKRPEVMEYLTRFTDQDLVYVDKLPEPQRTALRNNIQELMNQEKKGGKSLPASPALKRFLAAGAVAAPKNRKEAKDRLQKIQ